MEITINKTKSTVKYTANSKVADIVVSGGTSPYTYTLATGSEYFKISGTEVQVLADMTIDNVQSFSVTVTDSTSDSVTSDVITPNVVKSVQSLFTKANQIYKITKDIDLYGETLTMPEGCTLDFQGGSFSNGTIQGNNTGIKAGLEKIFDLSIELTGNWVVVEAYPEWFGARGDGVTDCKAALYACVQYFNKTILSPNRYAITNLVFDYPLYGKTLCGSVNYTNHTRISSSIIHIGIGDAIEFKESLHQFTLENLYIEITDNTVNAVNFNMEGSSSYNRIHNICIRGKEGKTYENTTAFNLCSGFANDFSRFSIKGVGIAFALKVKDKDSWITPLNIGGSEKCYIIDCGTGIYAELGNNILINNVLFERTTFPIDIQVSSVVDDTNNFKYITKFFVTNCYFERCTGDENKSPIYVKGINSGVKKASLIFKDNIIYDSATQFFELNNGYLLVDNKEGGLDYLMVKESGGSNLYYFTNDIYSQQSYVGYTVLENPSDTPVKIDDYIYKSFSRIHSNKEILLGNNFYNSSLRSNSVYNRTILLPNSSETSKKTCISIVNRKATSSSSLMRYRGVIQWIINISVVGGDNTEYECLYKVYGGTGNSSIKTEEIINQISNSSYYDEEIKFEFSIEYDSGAPIDSWYLMLNISSVTAGKLSSIKDVRLVIEEIAPYKAEKYHDFYNNSQLPTDLSSKCVGYSVFNSGSSDFVYWNGTAWVNMDGTALE